MKILYNILIYVVAFHLKIIAFFNEKIRLGVRGRANTFNILKSKITPEDKVIWFHCASLGEYEQGLPVFEEIKKVYPNHKIVLSFFSPSGYDIRKQNPITDIVVYLPLDTKQNAKTFLNLVHPDLVVFVKYELWPNYLNELSRRGIKSILISALFRKEQPYFKFYGSMVRKSLNAFEHIFVQNENSKKLLESIRFANVTVSGDTRFDRVSNQLQTNNTLDFLEQFKQDKLCIVAGSTWQEDEVLMVNYINSASQDLKFIIAPHNIKPNQIEDLKKSIQKKTILFSEKENLKLSNFQVFIIDTIGILSKIYSYSDIVFIGGAVGKTGLHNTLEAAVFGVPIIIGEHFKKFPEAIEMIKNGGMYAVSNQKEFDSSMDSLILNTEKREQSGNENASYINKNRGAVIQIIDYLRK
ncbi:3-deoxy-D-manno-octulosonic acid transferase [Flavobacteriaceae bacterium AH-315-B10]|nr:3-deoxy-D-manno-octulosonic acid transferase [Flavobacteriaceae bacterium AH-315-B10]